VARDPGGVAAARGELRAERDDEAGAAQIRDPVLPDVVDPVGDAGLGEEGPEVARGCVVAVLEDDAGR
jgi:hypothetical protein